MYLGLLGRNCEDGKGYMKKQGSLNATHFGGIKLDGNTVDGRNPDNQLRLVVFPIIYKVLAPSQVVQDFFHQQYVL